MESTPINVIIRLFHYVSQKLPQLTKWDSSIHGGLLGNNTATRFFLTELQANIMQHGMSCQKVPLIDSG